MQVLLVLLEKRRLLVTREELRDKLWPEATAGDFDHGLNSAVNRLREVLCDSAEAPRYVETLPKRGYRFIATVEMSTPEVYRLPLVLPPPVAAEPQGVLPRPSRRWRAALASVAVLALVGGSVLVQRWRTRQDAPAGNEAAAIRSIVVLPFENHSGDAAQEYLADGITDAVTTKLAQIRSLRVISRTSAMHYKGKNKPLPEIARELRVDAVLEGSVIRSRNRVRIQAQLIRAKDDTHLWAAGFERGFEDLLQLEAELAQQVADQVQATLTAEERSRLLGERRVDPEVYQLYLKGRAAWRERKPKSMEQALQYFRAAVERDPKFAPAYAGIADTYNLMAPFGGKRPADVREPARQAALTALKLDPASAEAHTSMGMLLVGDWRFFEAENHLRRAIELNPGYATGYHWYARYLTFVRRFDEAVRAMRRAIDLDPLDLRKRSNLAEIYMRAQRYEEAEREFRGVLELDPNYLFAHQGLGVVYWYTDRKESAIQHMQKARLLGGNRPEWYATLQAAYRNGGVKAYERRRLELMLEDYRRDPEGAYLAGANAYAEMGDSDRAIKILEDAYARREIGLIWLAIDVGGVERLRSDARFRDLLRRVGLPE